MLVAILNQDPRHPTAATWDESLALSVLKNGRIVTLDAGSVRATSPKNSGAESTKEQVFINGMVSQNCSFECIQIMSC